MRTISKHLVCQGKNVLELPIGALVLGVQPAFEYRAPEEQRAESLFAHLHVLADGNRPAEKRTFWGLAVGEPADHVKVGSGPEGFAHVGSWGDFHVFEQRSYL